MWAPRRTHARPLPTAPPDTLLTHSSILENTGALEQRHVDVMERVGGGWVGGLAEPEDGAAEAAERRSSMGVRRVGGRCSRGGGDVAVLQHVARAMIASSVGRKHRYFQLLCTLTICRR